jgi:hypothetical protein
VGAALARLVTGRCDVHDRAWPVKVAELEAATGINPDAVADLYRAGPDLVESFCDPDLIDCGKSRCRRRRGLG